MWGAPAYAASWRRATRQSPTTTSSRDTPALWGGSTLIEGDIADTALLSKTLRDFNAEAVMHFAAATNVGESV